MVSTAGTAVSVFPEWRFPNAGLRGHGGRNIQLFDTMNQYNRIGTVNYSNESVQ